MFENISAKKTEGLERYNQGLLLDAEGKTQEAVRFYREAVYFCPEMADAHYNLGMDLALLGLRDEAVRAWKRAIWLNSDYQHHLMSAFDIEHECREAIIQITKK